jgi:AraC-like DNA-binding protein
MTNDILMLLDLMRVQGTSCSVESLTAPWSLDHESGKGLSRLYLVLAGRTWIKLEGSADRIHLTTGDIVIVPGDTPHSCFSGDAPSAQLLSGSFEFTEATPSAIRSRLPDILVERRGQSARADKLNLLLQLISAEVSEHSEPQQSVLNRLTEILCLHAIQDWLENAMFHDETLKALASPRIKTVLDEIHSNPSSAWSVESLADIYGQSRTAFSEQFKSATGMSPITYVRQCRIGQARKMLENTHLPVDEVAYRSGYADANAFNRAFRREVGSSPGAYRRIQRG